jgi:hypothetical protein
VYAACDFWTRQADACDVAALAAQLRIALPPPAGNSLADVAALPAWATQQRQG